MWEWKFHSYWNKNFMEMAQVHNRNGTGKLPFGGLSGVNFLRGKVGGNVWRIGRGRYPDPHAGLQLYTSSGYD